MKYHMNIEFFVGLVSNAGFIHLKWHAEQNYGKELMNWDYVSFILI